MTNKNISHGIERIGFKRKSGFTLVELLAVIVILAVVATIVTPIIINLIENVKRSAFERSIEMAVKSYEIYRATESDVERIEITDERLPLEKNEFISGTMMTINEGEIEVYYVTDGKYCASGQVGDLTITDGFCEGNVLDDFVMKTYILSVDPNGGIWNENNETRNIKVLNNEKIDLVNPEREGYKFTGWEMLVVGNIDDPNNGFLTTNLKANWEANMYNLVIDPNGGIYDGSTDTKIVEIESEKWYELKEITREGYVFDGWEISSESTKIAGNQLQMGIENTTITAKWNKKHTLTINLDGGESTQSLSFEMVSGETLSLVRPTKINNIFDKWEIAGMGSKVESDIFTMGSENTTITAKWIKVVFGLTIDTNGGETTQSKTHELTVGDTVSLTEPTKNGYTFKNWSVSGAGSKVENNIFTMGTEISVVTANWDINNYSITYDLKGGSVSKDNATSYTIETDSFTLTNPIRTGYTFKGWTGSNGSTASTSVSVPKGSTGDKNYIANWNKISYSITYNLNSGTQGSGATTSYDVETSTFSLPTPTRTGYTFGGWYENSSFSGSKVTQIAKGSTGDKTYYAKWTINSYTLTANANGGSITSTTGWTGTGATSTKTLNYNVAYSTLPNISRTGYDLKGWYTAASGGSQVSTTTKIGAGNANIFAQWNVVNYSITYDLKGGSVSKANQTSYNISTASFTLTNPTKAGYTFKGWTGSNGSTASTSVTIPKGSTGNKTYTANWTANTYTIKYDCNGGSGSTSSSTHTYGTSKSLTKSNCYKITAGTGTGTSATPMVYVLAGWSKSNTATSATYTDGESVKNLTTDSSITLYAVWKKLFTYTKKYQVISDGSGNWRVKFLESGSFVPKASISIDAFLVGGGGGGCSGGGGGGYTTTEKKIPIESGTSYTITIGQGGTAGAAPSAAVGSSGAKNGGDGGKTSAFNYFANGGKGGTANYGVAGNHAGAGGSGGGGYGAGAGGYNGATGGYGGASDGELGTAYPGGEGQGSTTREFGESGGTLYAGGGGGGVYGSWSYRGGAGGDGGGGQGSTGSSDPGDDGLDNTGGGGGGHYTNKQPGGAGGSGIVIIRNKR